MHIISSVLFIISTSASSAPMECEWDSDYVNDWDGYHYTGNNQYFLSGVHSYHSNHREDRRFKWKRCKSTESDIGPFSGTRTNDLGRTSWDSAWTEWCQQYNAGDAAIYAIKSWHNNHREDREYVMSCGSLDRSEYRLSGCSWSGYINDYDGWLGYECPNNGVIRGLKSVHNNHREDRRYDFECCTLDKVTYTFNNIEGEWISKCAGCSLHTFTEAYGTQRATSSSVTTNFASSLTTEVSVGFQYKFASGSTTITGSQSQSIARTMSSAFSTSYSVSMELQCDRDYFYQWVMHGSESSVDGSGFFNSYSNRFICTDSSTPPQCLPGQCSDELSG